MKNSSLLRRSAVCSAALLALSAPAFAATYTFSGGNYTPGSSAPDPIGAGDVLNIDGGANKFFSNLTLTNAGTVNWNADTLFLSSSTFNNNGLWNATSNDLLYYYAGAQTVFNNAGTFRKSASAGTTTIGGVAFVNTGIVDAQTGTIDFAGGSASFLGGTRFTGAGVSAVTNNASFSGAFTSANLALRAGTFSGSGAIVNGSVDFAGGSLAGDWTVAANQQLLLGNGSNKFISNATLTNNGSLRWQAGSDNLYMSSSTIDNRYLFDVQGNLTLYYYAGSTPSFINSGTVQVSGGNTLTVGGIAFVNNGGTLNALAGNTINFAGGNATFNAGTQFSGAGTNVVTGNARFVGGFNSQNLVLQNGSFAGGDGVTAGSKAVLNGTVAFTGGSLTENWEIAAGQTLAMRGADNKFISNAAVVNKGTMAWQGPAGNLYLSSSSVDNRALFEAQADVQLYYYAGSTPSFTNAAAGTVRAVAGATLTVGGIAFVNNGGTLNALGTIDYAGGNATFNAGTQFSGSGVNLVTHNARFVDGFNSQNLVLQSGSFYGGDGTTAGSKAVLGGTVSFTGGVLTENWEIGAGQTLAMNAGGNKFIGNAAVVNKGTIRWQGSAADNLYMSSSSVDNQALFEARENVTLYYYAGSTPSFTNAASGTVRAAVGKTLTVGGVAFGNNGGTLNALGTIDYAGGNATFSAGTQFTGSGVNVVTGNARFINNFTSQNLLLQSGNFYGGDGSTPGSKAVLNGTVSYTGGTIAENWEIANGQTLVANGGGGKFISNASLSNKGTLTWQTSDAFYLSSSTITNQGKIDLRADTQWLYYSGGQPALVNNGVLVKSAGSGTADLSTLAVVNNGTIEVQAGTLRLPAAFANGGTIKGNGTVASTTLTNNGHIAPGASIGTLTLAGNLAMGTGSVLDTELQGPLASDLFLVTGTAALGGTLALHCFASCSFAIGDQLVILDSAGDLSGSFSSVTLDGFATGAFNVVYDTVQDRVLLQVTQAVTGAVPEGQTWALLLAGLGVLAWVARQRRA